MGKKRVDRDGIKRRLLSVTFIHIWLYHLFNEIKHKRYPWRMKKKSSWQSSIIDFPVNWTHHPQTFPTVSISIKSNSKLKNSNILNTFGSR